MVIIPAYHGKGITELEVGREEMPDSLSLENAGILFE
jgi:hypothetical protein